MPLTGTTEPSLRPGRFDYKRLAWAFAISLAVHLAGYGGYKFTKGVLPGWMQRVKFLAALVQKFNHPKPPTPPHPSEPPLVFVEVNPETATPEPPKNSKYYSSQNSHAADPDNKAETDTPKIDGSQQHVAKTETAPRKVDGLHPSAAPAKEAHPEEQAKPKPVIGDLAMAKPDTTLQPPDKGTAEQTRPRTLAEAKSRQPSNLIPGQKMKQDGGVRRHLKISSLDAMATPFGEYDREFIEAVQEDWYKLLDEINYSFSRHGVVVLQFHLNHDGTITDMKVVSDSADDSMDGIMGILCQRAVRDPAPFQPFPHEMRLQLDKDYREIQFTFFYD